MRQIVSISMPAEKITQVKKRVKERGFDNVSSYILSLVSEDDDLISATDLRKMADEAQQEYEAGKSIKVNSVMDLL